PGATALAQLGPDFRDRPPFAVRGLVAEGARDGDLRVVGRGDPSVTDHLMRDATLPLRAIADSLAGRGIHRIAGRVLPAGDAFPGDVFGYGWTYVDFESSYSAPVDELLFNEGFSVLHVRGGERPGDPVQVDVRPARSFPHVRIAAVTAAAQSPVDGANAGRRRRDNSL